MSIRIGADVGGTFTDIVIEVADGSYSSTKVLTTHDAPEVGILDGIGRIAAQENIDLRDVTQIIHGTTLATNALIERRGAKTALVTTDGFRDVIETRTESRFEQYDLNIVLPTPLIQRADRHVISERLNARGEILVPFDENGARSLVEHIGTEGYQSVAVGFIHSYVNPTNELRFRELLLADSIPVIEMIEIGAGGGSIASVDSLGQIRIGPHSAGSEPGPASYGRGGLDATVTDANVQLGRLHPDTFGAKDIDLSPALAAEALMRSVGDRLGLSAADAARGVAEVVDENMTNAARVHAVENGKDLAGYSMIAFGGGGPLHAGRLLDKLGLDELIVPPDAGVGSAVGFLRAPFAYEAVRSFYTSTVDFDIDGANRVLAELTDEAMAFVREGTGADVTVERQVAMRYKGQGWEIPVRLGDASF
ncbi:MAG: hydantoinase/oxoprolinase family protein, partial [Actinobacteria bacterium]|nr:hydantoinase/oxoprolinase family protein [Actinomycetota bacterium]